MVLKIQIQHDADTAAYAKDRSSVGSCSGASQLCLDAPWCNAALPSCRDMWNCTGARYPGWLEKPELGDITGSGFFRHV